MPQQSNNTTMMLPPSDIHTAFFYGTLMAPSVLYRVIYGTPSPLPYQRALTTIRPALLMSYQRHRVSGCDYPAITPQLGASVRGSVVTGLLEQDLRRLDVFEGSQYERVKVMVNVEGVGEEGEKEEKAETYVWRDSVKKLEDREWDFEEFRREKLGYWSGEIEWEDEGFDEVDEMVANDEAAAGGKRDPTGGRAVNGAIGRELEGLNGNRNGEEEVTRAAV